MCCTMHVYIHIYNCIYTCIYVYIKDYSKAISVDLVAELQVEVTGLRVVAEINSLSVISDDVLCSWVLVVATGNQFLHPVRHGARQYYSNAIPKHYITITSLLHQHT